MGEWHQEHPEEAARIAALPLSEQNAAERAAMHRPPSLCGRCNGNGWRFTGDDLKECDACLGSGTQ